jgi:hypothetical protein
MAQNAFKYEIQVGTGGKVEVFVLASELDDFTDLVAAASTNLDFWDNAWDDEDWN